MNWILFALLAMALLGCAGTSSQDRKDAENGTLSLRSPDGKIQVTVQAAGALQYAVRVDGETVLDDSNLGLQFRDGISLGTDVAIVKVDRHSEDSTWQNRLGKRRTVRDR